MIGLVLAFGLQVDSPSTSPSATPSPTPRPAPTARPLPQPTPPYLIGPKGWIRIAYPAYRKNYYVNVAGWTTDGARGEENISVRSSYSSGLTAQELAVQRARELDAGGRSVVSSRMRSLCGGSITGWELDSRFPNVSYPKTYETIFVASPTVGFSAEYERPSGVTPSAEAERALASFCPTRVIRATSAHARSAITLPPSWIPTDISLSFHLKPGAAIVYLGPGVDAHQQIALYRFATPEGVDPNVDADLKYSIDHMERFPYTLVSKRAVALCNGDGWMVVVNWTGPRGHVVDTMMFSYGAPYSYTVAYRRPAALQADPAAIKGLMSLCPPKST